MIPQQETRRLAAVMFADIEGYTSLFQRNEAAAIQQVNDHRKDLEQATRKYHGDIIQFYGDGSATVYESVIDAILSAIELQHLSTGHRIPVRVGIHMGDLLFKDGDIFGDVVNVASRIQSAGVPGSILVSKKVAGELTNHPDVHIKPIGAYTLKNVKERMELFAVNEPGLTVPRIHHEDKKTIFNSPYVWISIGLLMVTGYFLRDHFADKKSVDLGIERICIPPFKDFTSNPEFDSIGIMVSSILTKALSETADANVVSYESLIRYFDSNLFPLTQNSNLARKAGAEYVLEGNYSLVGLHKDTLYFWASIIDLRTGKTVPISIPSVYCPTNSYMQCVQEMANNLKGYWKSKDAHVFRIPDYKAWEEYLKAQKLWADPEREREARQHLLQAIRYDSNFIDAYFLLLDDFNNADGFDSEADTIELIRRVFTDMNARQENYLHYYEEDLYGHNAEAFRYFMKEYAIDPKDLFLNTSGMVLALEYINDPVTSLRMFREIPVDSLDLNACVYCRTRIGLAVQAYSDLGDQVNAEKLASRLKVYAQKPAQLTRLIRYYLNLRDTSTVNELIHKAVNAGNKPDDEQYYCLIAARYAMLNGENKIRDDYLERAINLYGNNTNRTAARCYYLKGDLARSEKIYLTEIAKAPEDKRLYAELGLIYAKKGNSGKANEMISKLQALKKQYDYGETSYFQGRIKANLGETGAAIKYMSTALDEGIKFRIGTTFQHDPDLMGLNQSPEYIQLLERNRQP